MGLSYARLKDEDGKHYVKAPERAGVREAGIDFYVPDNFKSITLEHGQSILIPMGLKVCLPEVPECLADTHEYFLEFINKSGVAYKKGLVVGSRVIDVTYQGELFLNLHNNTEMIYKADGSEAYNNIIKISPGDKIVQGVLLLVNTEEITEKEEDSLYKEVSQRGDKGFGSGYQEK